MMARAAGYPRGSAIADLATLEARLPALLAEDGPTLVELATSLAAETPMTAPRGAPFHQQVAALRRALLGLTT
jgi:hypothetical protein